MNRTELASHVLLVAIIVALTGLAGVFARAAYGQERSDARTVLLRAVVAEASWLERDHRAVLHTLARRAARAGISVEDMALRYCSVFKAPITRTWVLELDTACERPASWPERLDWEAHRVQCELTVERVDAFLAGDSIDPCKGRATHFGACDLAPDVANATSAGWLEIECGTASCFYAERRGVVDAVAAKGSRR
jgi:hypothetical protein